MVTVVVVLLLVVVAVVVVAVEVVVVVVVVVVSARSARTELIRNRIFLIFQNLFYFLDIIWNYRFQNIWCYIVLIVMQIDDREPGKLVSYCDICGLSHSAENSSWLIKKSPWFTCKMCKINREMCFWIQSWNMQHIICCIEVFALFNDLKNHKLWFTILWDLLFRIISLQVGDSNSDLMSILTSLSFFHPN